MLPHCLLWVVAKQDTIHRGSEEAHGHVHLHEPLGAQRQQAGTRRTLSLAVGLLLAAGRGERLVVAALRLLRALGSPARKATAEHGRAAEEPPARGRAQVHAHGRGARGPAGHSDEVGVAAEVDDVPLHPPQRQLLVQDPEVPHPRLVPVAHGPQPAAGHEAEGTLPKLHGHNDHTVRELQLAQVLGVDVIRRLVHEAATMYPDEHRVSSLGVALLAHGREDV
mmetsp:Transcript_58817/g.167253  ORF Transcript_58817/g.167253 Transcript_58817/m.167253 type:complete len:223 (-) Transcript_58817:403-1071(-)